MACIYKHVNKINGKVYIGSTVQSNVERRWRRNNANAYKSCTLFYRALLKYGWHNFKSEILEVVDEAAIVERESYYIDKYNSSDPEKGYNVKSIRDGKSQYSLEARLKISRSMTGRRGAYPVNRIEHVIVNGVESKPCSTCKEVKPLTEFGANARSWDKLHRYCKPCWNSYLAKKRGEKPKQPRKSRAKSTGPMPIQATSVVDLSVREFESINAAGKAGFRRGSIRDAIVKKRQFAGYMWSYKVSLTKLNARNLEVHQIEDRSLVKTFLDENHVQGFLGFKLAYGFFYEGRLVQVLTMGKPRFTNAYEWEIIRLATEKGTLVRGGFSKLLTRFIRDNKPKSIITYAKIGLAKNGDVYAKAGFKLVSKTKPGYHYYKDSLYLSRYQCQKRHLYKILGDKYDPKKTEINNMLDNGFTKVKDEGNLVYELFVDKLPTLL